MAFILTSPSWTSGTVDRILINDDKLYTESIEKRNAASSTELNEEYLAVTELHQTIELLQNVYYLDINDTETVYGRFERDNKQDGFRNLHNGLDLFLENHPAGILIANGISLAVFKVNDYFWMFDSHSRGPNGRKASKNGAAFLMRFESVQSLFKLVKCNVPKCSNGVFSNKYSLTPVRVLVHVVNQHFSTAQSLEIVHSSSRSVQPTTKTSSELERIQDTVPLMTSVLRPVDEYIPRVESIVRNGSINEEAPM